MLNRWAAGFICSNPYKVFVSETWQLWLPVPPGFLGGWFGFPPAVHPSAVWSQKKRKKKAQRLVVLHVSACMGELNQFRLNRQRADRKSAPGLAWSPPLMPHNVYLCEGAQTQACSGSDPTLPIASWSWPAQLFGGPQPLCSTHDSPPLQSKFNLEVMRTDKTGKEQKAQRGEGGNPIAAPAPFHLLPTHGCSSSPVSAPPMCRRGGKTSSKYIFPP